jgi:hypothetical protein
MRPPASNSTCLMTRWDSTRFPREVTQSATQELKLLVTRAIPTVFRRLSIAPKMRESETCRSYWVDLALAVRTRGVALRLKRFQRHLKRIVGTDNNAGGKYRT